MVYMNILDCGRCLKNDCKPCNIFSENEIKTQNDYKNYIMDCEQREIEQSKLILDSTNKLVEHSKLILDSTAKLAEQEQILNGLYNITTNNYNLLSDQLNNLNEKYIKLNSIMLDLVKQLNLKGLGIKI